MEQPVTDGLQFDVGLKLWVALEAKFGPTQMRHQLVALPSVTSVFYNDSREALIKAIAD